MPVHIKALANGNFAITVTHDGRPESGETIRPELTEAELREEMQNHGVADEDLDGLIAEAKMQAPKG